MSEIKNGGLDQYGAEPFEQQQFGTAGVEGVNSQIGGNTTKIIITFDVVEVKKNLGDDDASIEKNDNTQQNLDRVVPGQMKITLTWWNIKNVKFQSELGTCTLDMRNTNTLRFECESSGSGVDEDQP